MKTYKVRLIAYGNGYQVTVIADDIVHAIAKALSENPTMLSVSEINEVIK
jgi:hypothetical protein